MLRLLVIEGNNKLAREKRMALGGLTPAESYGKVLNNIAPASIDILTPADAGFNFPSIDDLSGYDGIALTGSGMHLYDMTDEIRPQIELAKLALKSGTPLFGSCWGLQILTTAAGCSVRRNPKGREVPVARKIQAVSHAMYEGKPLLFDAPAIHLDEAMAIPDGATLLASNAMSEVQAFEYHHGETVIWGVQYHPDYNMRDLAGITQAISPIMLDEGFFKNEADLQTYCADFRALHDDPNNKPLAWKYGFDETLLSQDLREKELQNWLKFQVKPTKSKRARG
jgi:GMP synthase (glutamine-hydrolysing)